MAAEQEVAALVTRLTGDSSGLVKALTTATDATKQAAQQVQQYATQTEGFLNSVKAGVTTAMTALGALGVVSWLSGSREAYAGAEAAQLRLNALISAGGRDAAAVTADYVKFAEGIAATTTTSKGAVMGMLRQAEVFGVTGEQAKQAAQLAIAAGAAMDQEAAGFAHAAAMAVQGRPEMLQMELGLRRIRDPAERAAQAQKILAAGLVTAQATGKTTTAEINRLWASFNTMRKAIGQALDESLRPWVRVAQQAVKVTTEWFKANKETILTVVKVGAAVVGAYAAYRTLGLALAVVNGLLSALYIKQAATLGLWVLWKAAVGAAALVQGVFNASLALYQFLIGGGSLAALAFAGAQVVLSAGVWLVNAALAVMDALLAPEVLVAAAATLVIIGGALVVAGAAAYGLWQAGSALVSTFRDGLPTATGPIAHVAAMFEDWWNAIQDVVRAAQVDLPLAWQIAQAGFALAVAQIEDAWPPVWRFIQDGFAALWPLVADQMVLGFDQALAHILATFLEYSSLLGLALRGPIDAALKRLDAELAVHRQSVLADAASGLADAAGKFQVQESAATKEAKARLADLRGQLTEAEKRAAQAPDLGKLLPPGFADQVDGAAKAVEKFDAALSGSAEAITRSEQYRQTLANIAKQVGAGAAAGAAAATTVAPGLPGAVAPGLPTGFQDEAGWRARVLERLDVLVDQGRGAGAKVRPAGLG